MIITTTTKKKRKNPNNKQNPPKKKTTHNTQHYNIQHLNEVSFSSIVDLTYILNIYSFYFNILVYILHIGNIYILSNRKVI